MNRQLIRKICVSCSFLILGIILGGIAAFYMCFKINNYFEAKRLQVLVRSEIMTPYSILLPLRKNDTATAIEGLEGNLDSGLFGLAYELANKKIIDREDRDSLLLEKIREYRTQYPRKIKISGMDEVINSLLFHPVLLNESIEHFKKQIQSSQCNSELLGFDVDKLAKAIDSIDSIDHVWEINGKRINEKWGSNLLFDTHNSSEIVVPKFKKILEADNHTLLACYGRIIHPANNGYIVGTVPCPPTNGEIFIFDDNFQKVAEIDSQKVIKIKIINLLDADTLQIMTWEDQHHGTNTTKRVLNIYMTDSSKSVKRIFEHDLIDATFSSGGLHDVNKEIYYRIDYQSLMKKKQIIVIREDNRDKEVYTWDGAIYKSDKGK